MFCYSSSSLIFSTGTRKTFFILMYYINRVLVLLKMETYQFGAPIVTEEQLREGKRQLLRHRKGFERTMKRNLLKNYILNLGKTDDQEGFCARLLGVKSSGGSKKESKIDTSVDPNTAVVMREPQPLSGIVEKKGSGNLVASNWKEVYATVKAPGFLHFSKDSNSKATSSSSETLYNIVDLRLVMSFKVTKKNHLELDLAEDTVKMKFKNEEDALHWHKLLMEWKDFNIDYGNIFQEGPATSVSDVEVGVSDKVVNKRNAPPPPPPTKQISHRDELNDVRVENDEDFDTEEDKVVRPLIEVL